MSTPQIAPASPTKQVGAPENPPPWPGAIPSLIEEIDQLVTFAGMVRASLDDGTLGLGIEIDEFDTASNRIVEACRWLQYHRADVTVSRRRTWCGTSWRA
ncbi:hypothetical protein [Actinokineospora diospyrosa]|uniref:Uncharacterized protein n=1 Tax=Actinokineospora diospyrosa TaxID=103728 RepID=A0ABT1I9I0_9PSEU|nr:hypothetical protein [Actinokineospora diospyrosa]MCP2269294.1 hypothetical protein [Actinokineospora diospyrosa]